MAKGGCKFEWKKKFNISDKKNCQKFTLTMNGIQIWQCILHVFTPTCCRYFTWDAHKFPSSKDMINGVAVKGRKMVTIVDPHLKRDDNYNVYTDAKNRDMMVKGGGGEEYEGWCWPGKQYEGWCWQGKECERWCWLGEESGKGKEDRDIQKIV